MTVRELIEKLQALPQDLPVYSTADWAWISSVHVQHVGSISLDPPPSTPDFTGTFVEIS